MAEVSIPRSEHIGMVAGGPEGISPLEAMKQLGQLQVEPVYEIPPGEIKEQMSPLQAMAMLGASFAPPTRTTRKAPLAFSAKEYARRKKKSRMAKISKRKNRKK